MTAGLPRGMRVGDRITPTGTLVSTAAPQTPEWFAVRAEGITATDIPKIIGEVENSYGNALSVWLEKRGQALPDDAGEPAYWGTVFEKDVAHRWATLNNTTVTTVGVLAHLIDTWKRCSLDRIVATCPDGDGPCALEVKSRSAFKQGMWRDDVPDDVLAQTVWQMIVTGYRHIHVACLIGGQRMLQFRVDWHQAVADLIDSAASKLWANVLVGIQPEVDPSALLTKILDAMHPDRTGQTDLSPATVAELVTARKAASDAMKAAKKQEAAAKAAIVQALGAGETITTSGRPIITYATVNRGGYTVAPTSFRQIKIVGEVIEE